MLQLQSPHNPVLYGHPVSYAPTLAKTGINRRLNNANRPMPFFAPRGSYYVYVGRAAQIDPPSVVGCVRVENGCPPQALPPFEKRAHPPRKAPTVRWSSATRDLG
jgi:hypothetical protein